MKLIVAGGRTFDNYNLLKEKLDYFLQNVKGPVEIVSGRCDRGTHTYTTKEGIMVYGADGLAERYAEEKGHLVRPFPADWDLGRKAGPLRNQSMGEYGESLIAFWDKKSAGTANMIAVAKAKGLPTRIVYY